MAALAHNTKLISHLDLPGAGQVYVAGNYAYVGHLPNKESIGTSIVDVSDPAAPRLAATITLDDRTSHSHKARVIGDLMIVNHECNPTGIGRKGEQLPAELVHLRKLLGREPTDGELAEKLGVKESDIARLKAEGENGYNEGGFKLYDVADSTRPRLIHHQRTGGIGVHRFDMDERYAYISTEMEGFVGNILVIYDISDPAAPAEISRWWMTGLPRTHPHRHAGAVPSRWPRRGLGDRRGGPVLRRRRGRGPARPAPRQSVAVRCHRSGRSEAALHLSGERSGFAVEPGGGSALRRPSIPGAHERWQYPGLLRLVRRRAAHRRYQGSHRTPRSGLLHPRTGRRQAGAPDQRRGAGPARAGTVSPASTSSSSAGRRLEPLAVCFETRAPLTPQHEASLFE